MHLIYILRNGGQDFIQDQILSVKLSSITEILKIEGP